jgi:hypothetical protein
MAAFVFGKVSLRVSSVWWWTSDEIFIFVELVVHIVVSNRKENLDNAVTVVARNDRVLAHEDKERLL